MKVLVNYADESFRSRQLLNSQSGLAVGGFDEAWSFGPQDIDAEFARRTQRILSQRRGAGFWLWKPYFVLRALERLSEGDYLFYADSGSVFLDSVDRLIEVSTTADQDLLCFELEHPERTWTKRDAFVLLDCDHPRYAESKQRLASFSLWKKSAETVSVAEQWLKASQDERLITDSPNEMGLPNWEGFQDHRHDQSVFSLLTKRAGLPAFRDPSQFGNPYFAEYPGSEYPQLIQHTRGKRVPLRKKVSRETRRFAQQCQRFLGL